MEGDWIRLSCGLCDREIWTLENLVLVDWVEYVWAGVCSCVVKHVDTLRELDTVRNGVQVRDVSSVGRNLDNPFVLRCLCCVQEFLFSA